MKEEDEANERFEKAIRARNAGGAAGDSLPREESRAGIPEQKPVGPASGADGDSSAVAESRSCIEAGFLAGRGGPEALPLWRRAGASPPSRGS